MFIYNCKKYLHRMPPYRSIRSLCYCNSPRRKYIDYFAYLPRKTSVHSHRLNAPVSPRPIAAGEASAVHADDSNDATVIIHATNAAEAANVIADPAHTVENANSQMSNLPPTLETMPPLEPLQHDACAVFSVMDGPVNMIVDALSRITDIVAQLIEYNSQKEHSRANDSGLYHFRQWWELVEVTICVGGELISGIPISVDGDVLRVVSKNHSYFIPLEKVDFIRSDDGLCSDATSGKPD